MCLSCDLWVAQKRLSPGYVSRPVKRSGKIKHPYYLPLRLAVQLDGKIVR